MGRTGKVKEEFLAWMKRSYPLPKIPNWITDKPKLVLPPD